MNYPVGIWIALGLLTACAKSLPAGKSGVATDKPLGALTAEEAVRLCRHARSTLAEINSSQGICTRAGLEQGSSRAECEQVRDECLQGFGGLDRDDVEVEECADDVGESLEELEDCTVTVGEYERCLEQVAATARSVSCEDPRSADDADGLACIRKLDAQCSGSDDDSGGSEEPAIEDPEAARRGID